MRGLFVRRVFLFLVYVFFLYLGVLAAKGLLFTIISVTHHWLIFLIINILGIAELFLGFRLSRLTKNVENHDLFLLSKVGLITILSAFLLGIGGTWTFLTFAAVLEGIFFLISSTFGNLFIK